MPYRILVPVSHPLGGIRTYMLYNFKRIHEAGFHFTFLSEAGNAFEQFKNDTVGWEGTQWIESPKGSGSRGLFMTLRRAIRSGSFSLIHSQGLKAGTITAAANLWRRVPHLITLHDVIIPGNEIPGRFKALKIAAISYVTRRASVIIPVSEDCEENHRQIFSAWNHGPVRVETILNGIDLDRIGRSRHLFETEGTPWIRKELGIAPSAVVGGFFGRFMPQKGFDVLLEALGRLAAQGYGDRFRLIATKDPNGYLYETVTQAAERPEVARMVHFIDARPDIVPLLLQSDLCVIPSRWEACPILPMEALVLGVPVVGTDCLGLREVLRHTPSHVVAKENAEALATALIDFIEHPTTEAAKEYIPIAAKRFDVNIAADKLLELYQRFL